MALLVLPVGVTGCAGKDADDTADPPADATSTTDDTGALPGDGGDDTAIVDWDGDGWAAPDDCDDTDAAVNPDAAEICDGVDNDCDGDVDVDADQATVWYQDDDFDGYGLSASTVVACDEPAGFSAEAGDCDDTDAAVNPGALEICDGVDNDCDARVDADADDARTVYADLDEDGFGDPGNPLDACEAPDGYLGDASDCDDGAASVNPDGVEVCNGVDDDCNGAVDDDAQGMSTWYADDDSDGYADPDDTLEACEAPGGYLAAAEPGLEDCNDVNGAINPGAVEVCNGIDDDCDDEVDVDPVDPEIWYLDEDSDGYGVDSAFSNLEACEQPGGYVGLDGDCDDGDDAFNPGAAEDDCSDPNDYNCDGSVAYEDLDGDGFPACGSDGDCDDSDADVNPDGVEICDGVDNDCDGGVDLDAADATDWYLDGDSDGYGESSEVLTACDRPPGYLADASDCDDEDDGTFPGAVETCDEADDDCDAVVDEGAEDAQTWYMDDDGDSYGDPELGVSACEAPDDRVLDDGDCDDADSAVHPGADERCDEIDSDCDLIVDEDALDAETIYPDGDRDGFGDSEAAESSCDGVPFGFADEGGDCDLEAYDVHPGAPEGCDGVDADCDGALEWLVPADYTSIQGAIDGAEDGDSVCVSAGEYVENLDYLGKALWVEGVDGSGATIIDGGGAGSVLTFQSAEPAEAVLTGFTLTGGAAERGGGIAITYGAGPTLFELVIAGNEATYGGGVYVNQGYLNLSDALVSGNTLYGPYNAGGGVWTATTDPYAVVLQSVSILGNTSAEDACYGAGLRLLSASVVRNVVVAGNHCEGTAYGAALYAQGNDLLLENVTVHGNTAASNVAGLYLYDSGVITLNNVAITGNEGTAGGGILVNGSPTVVQTFTDVHGNAPADYEGLMDPTGSDGNIAVDPLYQDVSSADPLDWSLRLSPKSPLIDAGDPALMDLDGSDSDIGAYGGPDAE